MWRFRKLHPGTPERDPHEAEFFRLKYASEAIVREFIQNSIDAKSKNSDKVVVSFTFGEIEKSEIKKYISEEFIRHYLSCDFAVKKNITETAVKYLVIEDYGTSGLDGFIAEENFVRPEERSNFYNFWWCEGKSKKKGAEGGRWGLGKTTFHQASKIRTFFGLTIREDDNSELLLGKTLLKTHRINDEVYDYYGYYTESNFLPVSNSSEIKEFKKKFNLKRKREKGFSITVLQPDEDINFVSITRSIIQHYFFAVLKGSLEINIYEEGSEYKLTKKNIIKISEQINWKDTDWEDTNVTDLLDFISNAIKEQDSSYILNTGSNIFPLLKPELFGSDYEKLKNKFNSGGLLGFKIPVKIKKSSVINDTFYYVIIQKSKQLKNSEEFYMRSGIMISGIRTLGKRSVRALLIAEDLSMSEFLGDAETPSHTEWKENTEGFKEKYRDSVKILRYVRKSVINMLNLFDQPPEDLQRDFLKNIFYIDEPGREHGGSTGKKIDIPKTKSVLQFETSKINGGAKIILKDKNKPLPFLANIKVAYDVRNGNPFTKYEKFDFDLKDNSIKIECTGGEIIQSELNRIKVRVSKENFALLLKGFDRIRDLVINVSETKK